MTRRVDLRNPGHDKPRPEHEPFEGLDRTGFVDRADLPAAELNALRRLNPLRSRWPELDAIEHQIAGLEQQRAAATADIAGLEQQRAAAPRRDAEALGAWQLAGGKGTRPTPTMPALDEQIAVRRADLDGLAVAVDRVLEDKERIVTKHRARLVKDADLETEQARARIVALVDELEQARDDLARCRQTAVWARIYPHPSASHQLAHAQLGGGLRRVAQILGTSVVAAAALEAFRRDADWLANAMTPEQRAAIGTDDNSPAAVWDDSPEADEARRKNEQAARDRLTAARRPTSGWDR